MTKEEIARLQAYLRTKLGNMELLCKPSAKRDMIEVLVREEFLGTIYRDEDDGEISYDFNMPILQIDLPSEG